jgi:Tfp pilus assembly PilM family ATPase
VTTTTEQKTEVIRSVMDRLQSEVQVVRTLATDLAATHAVTDVDLTRLETHAAKLAVYADLLQQVTQPPPTLLHPWRIE